MKIHPSRQAGNVLFVVMMVTGLIIAALGTYLNLASQEHKTLRRSFCWNAALPMAEAGIEEALSHLNKNKTNYSADGWGTNCIRHRGMGDDYYVVSVSGKAGSTVTITSTGFVHVADANYIARTVQVRGITARDFKFPGLIANNINFGGTFGADSYDSSDPNFNTGGQYDPRKATDQALIATPAQILDLGGNAHIKGYISSGPGGSFARSGSSSVGDMNWRANSVQSGHFTNGFTMNLPPVEVPYTDGDLPTSGNVGGTNYDYVLDTDQYFITNLTSTVYGGSIYVKGSATLYVPGFITLNKVVLGPNNARLDLFVGGSTISIAPVVVGSAPFFTLFALPSCYSMSLNNQTIFNGLIYAPSTILNANGGASVCGAIAANTFNCNGNFDFHYDLAFNKPRYLPPVRILSWTEL